MNEGHEATTDQRSPVESTYECPHCGGETFGLVVNDETVAYARCRLCGEVVLNG